MSDKITIEFTKAELAVFERILEYAQHELANNGCNDFPLANTDENWAIAEKYMKYNDDPDADTERPAKGQKIYSLPDFCAVALLRAMLKQKV